VIPNASWILGSEMLTMLPSSVDMNVPRDTLDRISHLRWTTARPFSPLDRPAGSGWNLATGVFQADGGSGGQAAPGLGPLGAPESSRHRSRSWNSYRPVSRRSSSRVSRFGSVQPSKRRRRIDGAPGGGASADGPHMNCT